MLRLALLALVLETSADLRTAESVAARALFDERVALDGFSTELEREELVRTGPASFVFVGHVVGDPRSAAVLSSSGGAVAGSIVTGERRLHVRNGLVGEVLSSELRELGPLEPVAVRQSRSSGDSGERLDLLVVYTPKARIAAGGAGAMAALIQLGVFELNLSLEHSLVPTRVRLVEAREVPYREAGRAASDLEILANPDDGALDEVHALRDAFGADFVQLVVEEDDGCGISYQLQAESAGFADWAFSVVERRCIDSSYALAHELGHNFGCDHAPEDPLSARGAFPFSNGYKDFANGFRTVMAYGPGTRLPRFSSPRIAFDGHPLGTHRQDNGRSITEMRTVLAGFRHEIPPPELEPRPGTFFEEAVVFRLEAARPVAAWSLAVGTTPGGQDVLMSDPVPGGSSIRVDALPNDGRPLHVRLFYRRSNVWLYEDFTY